METLEQNKIINWQIYPLHKPEDGRTYDTIDINGLEAKSKYKNNSWYSLDNRYILNQPIKFKDGKEWYIQ